MRLLIHSFSAYTNQRLITNKKDDVLAWVLIQYDWRPHKRRKIVLIWPLFLLLAIKNPEKYRNWHQESWQQPTLRKWGKMWAWLASLAGFNDNENPSSIKMVHAQKITCGQREQLLGRGLVLLAQGLYLHQDSRELLREMHLPRHSFLSVISISNF